jgi:hypothetical protein
VVEEWMLDIWPSGSHAEQKIGKEWTANMINITIKL